MCDEAGGFTPIILTLALIGLIAIMGLLCTMIFGGGEE